MKVMLKNFIFISLNKKIFFLLNTYDIVFFLFFLNTFIYDFYIYI